MKDQSKQIIIYLLAIYGFVFAIASIGFGLSIWFIGLPLYIYILLYSMQWCGIVLRFMFYSMYYYNKNRKK